MIILHTSNFKKELNPLHFPVRRLFKKQENIFAVNWRDSKLHVKKLKGEPVFSFRITRNYRVLFVILNKDTVFFTNIGHRRDIYD